MIYQLLMPEGLIEKKEIDYVVVKNEDGQIGILKRHIPIILTVKEGYIKVVTSEKEEFIYVVDALVDFKDNLLTVLAIESAKGETLEKAKESYLKWVKEKTEASKKMNIDYSTQERELKESIRKSRVGSL